jgi:glutamate-ammonia-ligase adenylyltransferase
LEFLVQFLVLNHHDEHLARYTHTLSMIKQLFLAHVLTKDQLTLLKKAYQYYHFLLHQKIVRPGLANSEKKYGRLLELIRILFDRYLQ